MKIFTKMSNDHLNNATKIANHLQLSGKYTLQAQLEAKITENDLLSVLVDKISLRLRAEIPRCTINGKEVIIETLEIIKILNEFCGYFLCYLNKDSIAKLESSIDIHLQNTKQQIKFCEKINIGIVPASIHKICKHTSTIVDCLKQYGFTFIYCSENRDISFDAYVLRADCLYLYVFDLNGIVSAFNLRLYKLKETPKIFYVNHVFNSILKELCWKKEEKYFYNSILQNRLLRSHYHLCHSKSEARLLELSCEKYKIDKSCIIKSGYPSFDVSLRNYNIIDPTLCGGGGKYLFIAPSYISKFLEDSIFSVILELLDSGIPIIMRGHPILVKAEKQKNAKKLLKLQEYKNFIFDNGNLHEMCKVKQYNIDSLSLAMYKSFALLCDSSSLSYTYPLVSLKPTIVLINQAEVGIDIENIKAYNKTMHLIAHDALDIRVYLNMLQQEHILENYKKQIRNYRDDEIYNIGSSSEFIALKIKEILG